MHKLLLALSVAVLPTFFLASHAIGQSAPARAPGTAAPTPGTAAPAAATLPPGPGRDTMVRVCSTCHAPEIVTQQRLSEQGWKELVDTMASRGAPASEAEFTEITAYLAKNFPDKPAQ